MCTLVHDIVICTLYRTCIVVSSIPLCFLISTDQTISTFFFSLHSRSKNKLLFCLRVKLSFFQTVQTDKEMHIYTEIPKHNNKIKYRNLQVTRNNIDLLVKSYVKMYKGKKEKVATHRTRSNNQ